MDKNIRTLATNCKINGKYHTRSVRPRMQINPLVIHIRSFADGSYILQVKSKDTLDD